MKLSDIRRAIINDPDNGAFLKKRWEPVYSAHPAAKILIIGQAPGRLAQESGIPWNDHSGNNLRAWMGIDRDTFYDEKKIALVPTDFYFLVVVSGAMCHRGKALPRSLVRPDPFPQ